MKIIVIGATRFIGQPITNYLLIHQHEVWPCLRNSKRAQILFPKEDKPLN